MSKACIAAACNPKNVDCDEVWVGLYCIASRTCIGSIRLSSCHVQFAVSGQTQV